MNKTIDQKNRELTISFTVDETPRQVFDAITNVRGWWGEGIEGGTREPGDEFTYRHKDMHYSCHRLTEVVPDERVVWLTTESELNFVDDKDEWTGTTIVFEIGRKEGRTTVEFTHDLGPSLECFSDCSNAWGFYVRESLRSLIMTGKGKPDPR
ncbi:MAG TPA: SRPBCC domain-containing protein [Puia sp.]|nr:SRPBCC domain-containing protein [Puia sp.]